MTPDQAARGDTAMTDVLAIAQAVHRRYETTLTTGTCLTPRPWQALPPDLQAEFIGTAQAALSGQTTYQGREIPTWVINTVKETK